MEGEELTIDQLFAEPITKTDDQENKTPEPAAGKDDSEKIDSTQDASETKEVVTTEVVPYTPEELKSIPIERLDPARIPEAAKPYYEIGLQEKKSLKAAFTKRSQELAEIRKGNEPRTIEEAFDLDPINTLGRIGQEIDKRELHLATLDPFTDVEENKQVRVELARLRILERNLNQRGFANQQYMQQSNAVISDTMSTVRQEIKDYDMKRPELEKYVIEDLGFTEQEIGILTDARIVGKDMAIKVLKTAMALFDMAKAGKIAEKKVVKPQPNKLEKDTTPLSSEKTNVEEMSFSELDKHLTKLGV